MEADNRRVKRILYPGMSLWHISCFIGFLLCTVSKVYSAPPPYNPAQDPNNLNRDQGAARVGEQLQGVQRVQPVGQNAFGHNVVPGGGANIGQNMNMAPQGGAPMGNMDGRPAGTRKNIMLSTHPDCQDDVEQLCNTNSLRKNNFAVLDCLQGDLEVMVSSIYRMRFCTVRLVLTSKRKLVLMMVICSA